MTKVQLFTDGAARGNPDGPGGYGAVLQFMDSKGQLHEKNHGSRICKDHQQPHGTDGGHCRSGSPYQALPGGTIL